MIWCPRCWRVAIRKRWGISNTAASIAASPSSAASAPPSLAASQPGGGAGYFLTVAQTSAGSSLAGENGLTLYTKADDTLHFRKAAIQDVHIREIIKYTDYQRFGSKVTVTYEGKEIPKGEQKPDDQKLQPEQNER